MRRPLRPCKHIGCPKLTRRHYCSLHEDQYKDKDNRTIASKEYERRRGSARERGYDTRWDKFRKWYLRRNPLCIKCGSIADLIHHIRPIPTGDKYDESNLQALCAACHNRIHHRFER